jgi:hypothetical protein
MNGRMHNDVRSCYSLTINKIVPDFSKEAHLYEQYMQDIKYSPH